MTIFQTAAQMTGRPYNNRAAVFGHSKTAMNAIANAANSQLTRSLSHGWMTWARALSGQRVRFTPADNGGYNGDTIVPATRSSTTYPGMTTRIDAFLASTDAATIIMQLHTNRTTSISTATGLEITVAESIAAMEEILAKCRAAGRLVILLTDDPRGDATFTGNRLSTVDTRRAAYINRYIMGLAGTPGIYVINTWDVAANPTSGFGDIQTLITYDGLHQTQTLAYRIGSQLAALFRSLFPPRRDILPLANTDAYDATDNLKGNLLTQAFFGGTTGTLASGGASAAIQTSPSGSSAAGIATGWSEAISAATSLTAIYSKVTGASAFNGVTYEGGVLKDWQQVNIGGTPTVAAEVAILRQSIPAGNLTIGDILSACAEVEVDSMSGMAGFGLRLYSPGISTLLAADLGPTSETAAFQMPNIAWSGVLKTLDLTIPTASIAWELCVTTIANQAASAAIRVRAASASKQ